MPSATNSPDYYSKYQRKSMLMKSHNDAIILRELPEQNQLSDRFSINDSYSSRFTQESPRERFQRCTPAPTSMSYLPSQERMTSHSNKIRTKVVGFDATLFDESEPPPSTIDTDELSRYPNAFSPMRSPRGIHSNVIKELKPPEVLHGHTIPTTPWLLRRGESKEYGVRRQISADNKLQLSPDIHPREKSTMHFNTPAQGLTRSSTLPSTGGEDFSEVFTPDVENLNLTPHYHQLQPMAITNRLKNRSKKNATWVDCYKIKRDRNKLNNLLTTKGAIDPQVEKMLPAF